MCANLEIYNKARIVPEEAKKPIAAGRLKGYTDINPMWRIKKLTELFGVCGIGWYTEIVRTWIDKGEKEAAANVEIKLYIKVDGEWSKGIPGIGASKFINQESKGTYDNDECYKCAYTDALSVACKQLGIGADVYFATDTDKYSQFTNDNSGGNKADEGKPTGDNKTAKNGLNSAPMTLEEALNHVVEVTSCKGHTLREIYADAEGRKFINEIYEKGSSRTRAAIEKAQEEISRKKAKGNKEQ